MFWHECRGGPHACNLILLLVRVGILSIQKYSSLTGMPFWFQKAHNALCCCCELLTAWARPREQWDAPEKSAAGRNTWHFSVMTTSLLLWCYTVCVVFVWTHVSGGSSQSDRDDKSHVSNLMWSVEFQFRSGSNLLVFVWGSEWLPLLKMIIIIRSEFMQLGSSTKVLRSEHWSPQVCFKTSHKTPSAASSNILFSQVPLYKHEAEYVTS